MASSSSSGLIGGKLVLAVTTDASSCNGGGTGSGPSVFGEDSDGGAENGFSMVYGNYKVSLMVEQTQMSQFFGRELSPNNSVGAGAVLFEVFQSIWLDDFPVITESWRDDHTQSNRIS